ncbi:MAG: S-layer homology domain-containing protein, partial [Clostridia bacterium]|nr:S-layer homology domain-containing protein [Clostridia bacterium]
MRFKQVISLVLAASVLAPSSIAVNAEDKNEPATREYVISEFVRSVGRNNLTIKTDQIDKILKAFSDSEDVEEEYREDVARAKAYNLIAGYEDGTLKPLDSVRRIEAMVMLSRALPDELDEVTEPIVFTDVPEWAKADIDRLSSAGLVNGYGDRTLGAEDRITIEQVGLITDRSDNILNTVDVGESFYGYVNNKIMRNYDASGETVIDPIHGALITTETSWSHFEDRMQEVSEQEMDVLKRLIGGEIEFEKGTAEQRVYDFYDCIKHIDEDRPKDRETYYEFRDSILDANTPEELMAVAADIYKETGVRILYNATSYLDKDSNIACPSVQMLAPEYASMIAFDGRSEKKYAEKYKDALADYAA